jgi:hypothetical protein
MSKFWIDFIGSVPIEAETKEEAEMLFWDGTYDELEAIFEIDRIEKED